MDLISCLFMSFGRVLTPDSSRKCWPLWSEYCHSRVFVSFAIPEAVIKVLFKLSKITCLKVGLWA